MCFVRSQTIFDSFLLKFGMTVDTGLIGLI